ncbi:MAG: hypothetical protein ACREUU_12900 [Gammaproteobacteria bacterium]
MAKEIGQVRNDIEPAGYTKNPMPAETIKRKILELMDRLGPEEETASA